LWYNSWLNSYFGRGQDLAVYSHVRCNGTEIDLLHCLLQQGGVPQCDHTKDIGISTRYSNITELDNLGQNNAH
jgi:hypothetical protein